MALIEIRNLTFSYDGSYDDVFSDVSFRIDTDWRLGFVGRNGRGKTTFLRLLLGLYEYKGTINSPVGFEYFPFEIRDSSADTLDVLTGASGGADEWKIIRELSLLDVKEEVLYRRFDSLSNGERTKALLAALFLKPDKFLLIDEPTNHLDAAARAVAGDYLRAKKGFILVSHDRMLLDRCADHILSINKTDIEIQKGNFSSWFENKTMRDEYEAAENERLSRDIKKLSEAAKRTAAWSDKVEKSKHEKLSSGLKADKGYIGHKAAKLMKASKSIEKRQNDAIGEKSRLLKNVETADGLSVKPIEYRAEKLVEFRSVGIYYGRNKVCGNLGFTINRGDRAVVTGKNGSGKSSVLKLICEGCAEFFADADGIAVSAKDIDGRKDMNSLDIGGIAVSAKDIDGRKDMNSLDIGGMAESADGVDGRKDTDFMCKADIGGADMRGADGRGKMRFTGAVEVGSGLKISYVPQDASFLKGGLKEFAVENGIEESFFKTILKKLDFSREQFDKDMSELSEGQKKKVLIAKSLCERANLYVWDEPLNYIDVFSRLQIEDLILKDKPTMLFVEHDAAFTEKIATKIIET
ncbi:MAG: ATP-binding cassette domain-containing protein [Clostridiales bacterium]|jgi:lincosamide and streptogramin A transport system ATP-binding/permease protein|nr:ATP-binding cassette domain-containing protein [Clostridiales bacterium]